MFYYKLGQQPVSFFCFLILSFNNAQNPNLNTSKQNHSIYSLQMPLSNFKSDSPNNTLKIILHVPPGRYFLCIRFFRPSTFHLPTDSFQPTPTALLPHSRYEYRFCPFDNVTQHAYKPRGMRTMLCSASSIRRPIVTPIQPAEREQLYVQQPCGGNKQLSVSSHAEVTSNSLRRRGRAFAFAKHPSITSCQSEGKRKKVKHTLLLIVTSFNYAASGAEHF